LALINRPAPLRSSAPTGLQSETCKSLGLKALFELLDADRKYGFLDLGPAIGPNIDFISRFSSRIRVENLYRTLSEHQFFERQEEPMHESPLDRLLSPPDSRSFDVILSWDIVNYFRPDEARALVRYIERFCSAGSLFFAIISTRKEMPVVPMSYRILDTETLLYTAHSSDTRPCPRYAPRDLGLLMSGFHAHSSYMLRNGMQEYLFVRD
jgi:hypothetical protein